ncbi:MAG: hypothetical protein WCS70_05380 [Verrucomicrobiota bacterium]
MNPAELNAAETEREAMLGQLQAAEAALWSNLHCRRVDMTARAHMERALAHVREASAAILTASGARTVDQLVSALQRVQHGGNRRLRQLHSAVPHV